MFVNLPIYNVCIHFAHTWNIKKSYFIDMYIYIHTYNIYIHTLCVCTHSHLIFPNTQPNVDESLRLGHNASKWPWSRNPKGGRDRRRFAVCHGLPPSNRVPPANVKTAILGDVKNISWKNPWALLRLVVLLMVQKSYIQSPDLGCIKRCK